jgi:plasmid maintenance system antidote protein VapI
MKLNKLKAKIIEKGLNVEALADKIGIDRSSLYRKLNNFDKITIGEAIKMKDALEMTDEEASDIFLA